MSGASSESFAAIILAAGISSRMGRNKLLLSLDGEPLVRRAAREVSDAGLAPVVVVVGFEADLVRAALDGLDCQAAINPDYDGPSSRSMHAGLRALPPDAAGAVVVLPDMVHVTADMLRGVRAAGNASPAPLVVSRYGDVKAPPILFRRSLFDELLAWRGEGCGKPVVKGHANEAVYLDWPPGTLDDVDTPEDFARVGALL